jgi:hypothetical protein
MVGLLKKVSWILWSASRGARRNHTTTTVKWKIHNSIGFFLSFPTQIACPIKPVSTVPKGEKDSIRRRKMPAVSHMLPEDPVHLAFVLSPVKPVITTASISLCISSPRP